MTTNSEVIRAALEDIARESDGRLTAEAVVKAAADADHPLHSQFEWDDKVAAHDRRIDQARALIRGVRVTISTDKRVVSTVWYVRDPSADAKEQGYVSLARLRTDEDLARAAIVDEFSRAASLLQRARDLAAVLEMETEVDELITSIERLKTRAEANTVTQ
jgi:hypothetical protein